MVTSSYQRGRHGDTGWEVLTLSCAQDDGAGQTSASLCPEKGSNLLSFQVEGTEYLLGVLQTADQLRLLGAAVLYPTPNRVRNARFRFGLRSFSFPPNNGPHFIHGLVRNVPWACDEPMATAEGISVTTRIAMAPGDALHELFPISNALSLTLTLRPRVVRFDFTVQNDDPKWELPFGLAIHPYFRVIGPRESVRVQVPAKLWMEAVSLMPTGRMLDLSEAPADLNAPTSLASLDLDDVYWGMETSKPMRIFYDDIGKVVTLTASDLFTHAVAYTPPRQSYFCLENQSCSTDAHNLHAQGLARAAHLSILEPGQSLSAWVEIAVGNQ